MSQKLLTDRRFWPMFWTQFSGAFNDNLFKNALGIFVVYSGLSAFGLDEKQLASFTAGVFILPYFLFSAKAGELADKYEKSQLIRATKIGEIGIMCLGAMAFLTQQIELLVLVLFLMGTQSALFGPVKYGILPQLIDEDDLVGGNALVELATYVAILGGTISAGMLVTLKHGEQPIGLWIVSASVIAISLVGWAFSRKIVRCEATDPNLAIRWSPILWNYDENNQRTGLPTNSTLDLIKLTMQDRTIFLSALGITWFWSFGTAFLSLFLPYAKEDLGGQEGVVTLFLASFSIGIAIGSMLCERLSRHRLEIGVVPVGAFGMSVFCAALYAFGLPWQTDPNALISISTFFSRPMGWAIFASLLTIAICGGLYIVPLYTLIQQRSPPESRSRMIAGNNILNAVGMVSMSLILVFLQGRGLNAPQIFGLLAVANGVAAITIFTQVPEFMLRFVVWSLSVLVYRIEVIGLENIPKEGPCLIAPNHVSYVDWLILAGAIKRPVHFIMDKNFASLPVMSYIARNEWVIPIASPKRDEVTYEQAFVSVRRKLREGWIVGIFSEGHLTEDGQIDTFKRGVETIIERDPVPVIPVALNGLWGSWFSRKDGPAMSTMPSRFFSRITVTIGEAIPPEEVSAGRVQEAVEALWSTQSDRP